MILLVCDHAKRELVHLKLLKKKLNSLNIKSVIINKHSVLRAYNYYKPKIIIFPHSRLYLSKNIDKLYKKVILILIPSEHCALNVNFIKLHYCGYFNNNNIRSSHKKMDYVFVQGPFIKKHLIKNKYIKKDKIIVSGHLHYDFWAKSFEKKDKQIKNIGIALTNEMATKRHENKNFLKTLFLLNNEIEFYKNNWRLLQMNYDFYYVCLVFDIIKKLINNFKVSLRTHVVDVESKFDFIDSENFNHTNKENSFEWIKKQDLIISSTSFMNIDAYVFKKPHISLSKLIPNEFIFKAYKSFTYREFPEPNSFKPKTLNEFFKKIKSIKFKKNKKLDIKLSSFYNYPYKKKPIDIIGDELFKIQSKKNYKFDYILLDKDKFIYKCFGKSLGSFIVYQLSQLYNLIKYKKNSKNWYFDFFFKQ